MTARNDHSSETTGAGGESPREPLVDRQLELALNLSCFDEIIEGTNIHV